MTTFMIKGMMWASPGRAWAIGRQEANGFNVRRIVWGLLLAQKERRNDEEIRAAGIIVEECWKPRHRRAHKPSAPSSMEEGERLL